MKSPNDQCRTCGCFRMSHINGRGTCITDKGECFYKCTSFGEPIPEMIDEHKAGVAAFKAGQGVIFDGKDVTIGYPTDRSMKLVCIEGNIGVGKSTLTKELAEKMGARAMFEPVDSNPYLERYYREPKRYALEMQFWLMSVRFSMHEDAIRHIWKTGQSVIMDRSIYGDWVFAKKNWLDGNIDDVGYKAYLHHRNVMNRYLMAPHVVLSLEITPELARNRIHGRGRDCEKEIPLGYLMGLHELHRELMIELEQKGSKVLTLDWSEYGSVAGIAERVRR